MRFRTGIDIDNSSITIEHSNAIFTIGSCFAENIATYFRANKFNTLGNPFGVLYNPISIYNSLKFAVERKRFNETDLIFHQSEWHSFYHHSKFSHHDKDVTLQNINNSIGATRSFLKSADVIVITFGTSYVYQHLEKKIVVSNCHKIPQKEFSHSRLSLAKTTETIIKIIRLAKSINPDAKFILTVSPIRHWKNGATNNQLSKATLLLAIDEAINSEKDIFYFPSYEILMDDLRDYRFYSQDLIHPNKIATDYIWEKFTDSLCSTNCLQLMKNISKITAAKNHRVKNINSEEHKKFVKSIIKKIEELQKRHKHLLLHEELDYFNSQLV